MPDAGTTSLTISWQTANPNTVPFTLVVNKGSKIFSRFYWLMPSPVSEKVICTAPFTFLAAMVKQPPLGIAS